ncbi:MAG: hypothetical protein JXR37_20095 [Kiritimatiellae bacterium]|nr:hypothetical protein [Kiritimatiellia bacterium]
MRRHILILASVTCTLSLAGEKIRIGESRPGTVRLGESRRGTIAIGENRPGTIRIGESRPGAIRLGESREEAESEADEHPAVGLKDRAPSAGPDAGRYRPVPGERLQPTPGTRFRIWTLTDGKQAQARLVGLGPSTAALQQAGGVRILITRTFLGETDRAYLEAYEQVDDSIGRARHACRYEDAMAALSEAIARYPTAPNIVHARHLAAVCEQALAFDREQAAKGLKNIGGLWVAPEDSLTTNAGEAEEAGRRQSPPEEQAAKRFVRGLADRKVAAMLADPNVLAAAVAGTVFEPRDSPECDAVVSVYYEFVVRTRQAHLKRDQACLRFRHDPTRADWIYSEMKAGRLP